MGLLLRPWTSDFDRVRHVVRARDVGGEKHGILGLHGTSKDIILLPWCRFQSGKHQILWDQNEM